MKNVTLSRSYFTNVQLAAFAVVLSFICMCMMPMPARAAAMSETQIKAVASLLHSFNADQGMIHKVIVDLGGTVPPPTKLTQSQITSVAQLLVSFGADKSTVNKVVVDLGGAVSAPSNVVVSGNSTSAKLVYSDASNINSYGVFTIKFKVTATEDDVYIPRAITTTARDTSKGTAGVVVDTSMLTPATTTGVSPVVTADSMSSEDSSLAYFVEAGTARTFTATVMIDPPVSAYYRVGLDKIRISAYSNVQKVETVEIDQQNTNFQTVALLITKAVKPAVLRPYCNIAPSALALKFGQPVTVTWLSRDATSANLQPGEGPVALKGAITRTVPYAGQPLPFTKRWTLTVTGPGGSIDCSALVRYTLPNASSTNATSTRSSYDASAAHTLLAAAATSMAAPFNLVTNLLSNTLLALGLY